MLTVILQNEEDKCWIGHHHPKTAKIQVPLFYIYFTQNIMAANNSSFCYSSENFVTI